LEFERQTHLVPYRPSHEHAPGVSKISNFKSRKYCNFFWVLSVLFNGCGS
jgi:hypothetical protein